MNETPLTIRPAEIELAQPFNELVDATLRQIAASSARIHGQTFNLWRAWCLEQQFDPFDLRPANVLAFLGAQFVAKSTRQRKLCASWRRCSTSSTLPRIGIKGAKLS